MDQITKETRREAYETRPVTRQEAILLALGDKELTARQIADALGFTDLNAVKPRLTELRDAEKIEAVAKTVDPVTGRKVAVYKRKDPLARA